MFRELRALWNRYKEYITVDVLMYVIMFGILLIGMVIFLAVQA
ncbi:MAG: hypothetical protein NW241_02260 [Bacteroidia bacterium]|nr:hypothetical protein [Bacteroidia bacterium]